MILHKTRVVFDEVTFLGCQLFILLIDRPEFKDQAEIK